jgi:hypothetical protein
MIPKTGLGEGSTSLSTAILLLLILQMRPPINRQPLLEILTDDKLLVPLPFPPQMLNHTDLCILIRTEEERDTISLLAADIPHAVHSTLPPAARHEFQKVRDVDDKRVGLRVHGDPYTIAVEHFERGIRGSRLAHEREPAEIRVCADPHIGVDFLGWVVHGADIGHGVCGYGVEVVFGKVEGESEDVQHAFAEGVHGVIVAVDSGAPEEGGGVRGPLVAGFGCVGCDRAVLLRVCGVFAHEEPLFEV